MKKGLKQAKEMIYAKERNCRRCGNAIILQKLWHGKWDEEAVLCPIWMMTFTPLYRPKEKICSHWINGKHLKTIRQMTEKEGLKQQIGKLKRLSAKLDYRFYLSYTNNKVDKNKGYWSFTAYPYIMGYPESKIKSYTLEKAIERGLIFFKNLLDSKRRTNE